MNLHPPARPLPDLLREADMIPPPGTPPVLVTGVSTDSRRVRPGDLFIAIRGMHTDARDFITAAARQGAVAVVAPFEGAIPPGYAGIPIIPVENARVAMACLLDAWYGHPACKLTLVGVTGTNGKTSVSSMLFHILRTAGRPCGLIGTVGCMTAALRPWVTEETTGDSVAGDSIAGDSIAYDPTGMTTPDPQDLYKTLYQIAEAAPAGATPVVILEVTSHALYLGKVAPLLFDLAIFTNLTPEHLDMHGTMEEYYAAKRRLFAVSRQAVINADDRYGRRLLAEPLPVRHWHICHVSGLDGLPPDRMCPTGDTGCTRFYAEQPKLLGEDGVSFKLTSPDVRVRLRCPVPGQFTVMNALEAATAALALGLSPATLRDALPTFPGVPGRMERVTLPGVTLPFSVYIDFAHTPDALEHLLGSVHAFRRRGQRIILLFGCGGDRDRSKRRTMAQIASRMADSVVVTSDNSRGEEPEAIITDILRGMDKESEFAVIPDRREAIRTTIRNARPGDIILLAGKGHETYEIDKTGKHPFSERDIATEAMRTHWGSSR